MCSLRIGLYTLFCRTINQKILKTPNEQTYFETIPALSLHESSVRYIWKRHLVWFTNRQDKKVFHGKDETSLKIYMPYVQQVWDYSWHLTAKKGSNNLGLILHTWIKQICVKDDISAKITLANLFQSWNNPTSV